MRLAESDDLVHWRDLGIVLRKEPDVDWLGTGHTWKVGDRYVLNYSECRKGLQRIFMAESRDLLHWTKLGPDYECRADSKWYQTTHEGSAVGDPRWDCIYVVPAEDGRGFIGYLTATANYGPLARRGIAGCVRSLDGRRFYAVQPASEPGLSSQIEVGGVAKIGDRWYMAVSLPLNILGQRNAWPDKGTGTQYLVCEHQTGPFRLPQGTNRLLSSAVGGTYFGRLFSYQGQVFFNHHSIPSFGEDAISFAPLKLVKETAPGQIALFWWPGNDVLRGDAVTPSPERYRPSSAGNTDPCAWEVEERRIVGDATSCAGVLYAELPDAATTGVVVDLRVTRQTSSVAAGLFLGYSETQGMAMLLGADGAVEFGKLSRSTLGWGFGVRDRQEGAIASRPPYNVRLLARCSFMELYIDDRLINALSLEQPFRGLGLVVENGRADIEALTVSRINL